MRELEEQAKHFYQFLQKEMEQQAVSWPDWAKWLRRVIMPQQAQDDRQSMLHGHEAGAAATWPAIGQA